MTKKIKRLLENLLRRHRNEEALEDELRAYIEELTDRKSSKAWPAMKHTGLRLSKLAALNKSKRSSRGAAWIRNR